MLEIIHKGIVVLKHKEAIETLVVLMFKDFMVLTTYPKDIIQLLYIIYVYHCMSSFYW